MGEIAEFDKSQTQHYIFRKEMPHPNRAKNGIVIYRRLQIVGLFAATTTARLTVSTTALALTRGSDTLRVEK